MITRIRLSIAIAMLMLASHAVAQPVVRVAIEPAPPYLVGQQIHVHVRVFVPNFFMSGVEMPPILDVPGAVVTMPDDSAVNLNDQINGESYAGIQKSYLFVAETAGSFTLPATAIKFKYAAEPGKPVDASLTLPSTTIVVDWPEGITPPANGGPVLMARVSISQKLDRNPATLKAGEALTRTIVTAVDHTQSMFIPPPAFAAPRGARVYPKDPVLIDEHGERGELSGGRRTDRAVYVFERSGEYDLPAFEIAWFDLEAKVQHVARAQAVHVSVALPPLTAGIAPEDPKVAAPTEPAWRARARAMAPWAAIGSAVLLLIALAAWLLPRAWAAYIVHRRRRELSEPFLFQRVCHACRRNDALDAYAALLTWVREKTGGGLREFLASPSGRALGDSVASLEARLFSATTPDGSWTGSELERALKASRDLNPVSGSHHEHSLPQLNGNESDLSPIFPPRNRSHHPVLVKRITIFLIILLALPPGLFVPVFAQGTAVPPPGTSADDGWPRTYSMTGGTGVLYQPQVESWDNQKHMVLWAAVGYTPTGVKEPIFGTVKLETDTKVSVEAKAVSMDGLKVTEFNFPKLSRDQARTLASDVAKIPTTDRVIDLDRVLAAVNKSPLSVKNVEGIKADPPKIFSSTAPAILVSLDGPPIWNQVPNLDLQYAVNTNWDLFQHTPTKTFFLRDNEHWLKASAVEGPYAPAGKLPDSFKKLPADENWSDVRAAVPGKSLSAKDTPKVFVTQDPAELIKIDGAPNYLVVGAAPTLLWVSNTESDLFRMGKNGDYYYLVAGRWFKASGLDGPWTFATPNLPADFKQIPLEHPRSRVLASVPGTDQATEAVLMATVPRTARVNIKETKAPDVAYQGQPEFKPINGSKGVDQAVNTDKDIVRVGPDYYMCYQGVWFTSKTANGPWTVTKNVPDAVYTIPSSSPVHHVTYVTVEEDNDNEWATFAYVAAYTGLMIGWGCAVWGSGWYYPPYVFYGGMYPIYYPYMRTYGFNAWYNPHTGFYGRGASVYGPYGGAGMAAAYNPRTGTYARGAAAYGPYGSRSAAQAWNPRTGTYAQTRQGNNIYGNWGSSTVRRGDEWAQTAHNTNYARGTRTSAVRGDDGAGAVTRQGPAGHSTIARGQDGDIYAGHNGNVYRKTDGGWQEHGDGGWNNTTRQPQNVDRDWRNRSAGNQRTVDRSSWQRSGASRAGAGSFHGGGMRGGGGRRR